MAVRFMSPSHVIAWRTIDSYLDDEINRTLSKFSEEENENVKTETLRAFALFSLACLLFYLIALFLFEFNYSCVYCRKYII